MNLNETLPERDEPLFEFEEPVGTQDSEGNDVCLDAGTLNAGITWSSILMAMTRPESSLRGVVIPEEGVTRVLLVTRHVCHEPSPRGHLV